MRLRDRVRAFIGRQAAAVPAPVLGPELMELPLRREQATERAAVAKREALTLSPMAGMIDADDNSFRRLSSGAKFRRRDLTPMAQDRMLEIAWYLWEQNPFARRLITCMTDLVVGEGVGVEADNAKILEAARNIWNHPINRMGERAREFHDSLSLNGEIILPIAVNDVTGVPRLGFIDPYQIADVEPLPDNIMVPDVIVLKKQPDQAEPTRIQIVHENPLTGELEGDAFYFAINKLPNSLRGRSDLLALADWLDLFDQYMFAEVERVRLLSAFVWDLEIKDGTSESIRERLAEIGTPQSGTVFGRNQNETLTALSPSLNATDRTETARLLTIHIAGSLGMPISWFGWQDSNRATIEGQNDVAMKTPAARQKQFGGFLNTILRFGIEKQRSANRVLFRTAEGRDLENDEFAVVMPEIAAKDVSRVSGALAQVVSALDAAMQNRTMSRRVATVIQLALTKHLGSGFDFKADDVMSEADADAEERQANQDDLMSKMAAAAGSAAGAAGVQPQPPRPGAPRNPPPRTSESLEDLEILLAEPELAQVSRVRRGLESLEGDVREIAARQAVTVHAPVTVHPADVRVEAPRVEVTLPPNRLVRETTVHRNADKLIEKTITTEGPDDPAEGGA